jgi:hypothetical protein
VGDHWRIPAVVCFCISFWQVKEADCELARESMGPVAIHFFLVLLNLWLTIKTFGRNGIEKIFHNCLALTARAARNQPCLILQHEIYVGIDSGT